MYECFHCGERAVIWDCDYDFEDFGYDGDGGGELFWNGINLYGGR